MKRALPALFAVVIGLGSVVGQPPAQALEPAFIPARATPSVEAGHTRLLSAEEPPAGPSEAPTEGGQGGPPPGTTTAPNLQVSLMLGWLGPGNPVQVTVIVHNDGAGTSTGHTLDFAPQEGSDRQVLVDADCTGSPMSGFRCVGGALQPGESRSYDFRFSLPAAVEAWPPFWTGAVTGAEPDAVEHDDRAGFELPDSTFVRLEADIKTRVDDTDGDGRATPGEPMEVYVYFANTSEYELEEPLVAVTGAVWDHRSLPQTIAPGEEMTVRFDATVPDLGADASSGVEANVTARAVGATVSTWSGTLMLIGPYAAPSPEGIDGEQNGAVKHEVIGAPAETLDEVVIRSAPLSSDLAPVETREDPPLLGAPSTPREAPAELSPIHTEQSASATRERPLAPAPAQTPSGERGSLSITGSDPLRTSMLGVHVLVALGIVFAHVGLSRQARRTRAGIGS